MKKSQIALIIFGFVLLALMATNPSIEDHRQAVMEQVKKKMSESSDGENKWEEMGKTIGMALGQGIVEKAVTRDNYLLFSVTKLNLGDIKKNIGFGVLGKVYVSDYNDANSSKDFINKSLENIKDPQTFSGIYKFENENSEKVAEIKYIRNNQFNFEISIGHISGCEGQISGVVIVENNVGSYIDSETSCSLKFEFSSDNLSIKESNCDLNHGARCSFTNGNYKKISSISQ